MSFLFGDNSKLPDPRPRAMGVDDQRLSSNERARPVQYFAGKRRVAVHPITDVFDVRKVEVTREAGKQKTRAGHNYFASFAGLIGHGPLHGIQEFVFNGETVWRGNALRTETTPHFVNITIPEHGLATVILERRRSRRTHTCARRVPFNIRLIVDSHTSSFAACF